MKESKTPTREQKTMLKNGKKITLKNMTSKRLTDCINPEAWLVSLASHSSYS
ncbi:MAG: DUF3945 domain-containing protein [Nanoarchaeota archaeon]|nr:DUF3945 domain-containing protein [Nanoarchaeota archaeon]